MGRKSITQTTVVVQIEDDVLVWTEGVLSGTSKEYIAQAKLISAYKLPVSLSFFGPVIEADLTDDNAPEKAVAALMGVLPGRALLLQAPPEVMSLLPFGELSEADKELLSFDSDDRE